MSELSRPTMTVPEQLWTSISETPLVGLALTVGGKRRRIYLKLEGANPTGSVKDRTAAALLTSLHVRKPLVPGTTVVESTSGNLGLALAQLLTSIDCALVAVVDPKTPPYTLQSLHRLGARICMVDEPDEQGGYLLSRLRRVKRLRAENSDLRWSNQYANQANPRAHRATTGPELYRQLSGRLGACYVPVSTGGTLAGISEFIRPAAPGTRIVAVDALGSIALGGKAKPRYNTGVGASRPSSFLRPDHYDAVCRVDDAQAFALCRVVYEDTGIAIGGSSGCAVAACLGELGRYPALAPPVCLCPDSGSRYRTTFFDDRWLADRRLLTEVERRIDRLRHAGLHFEVEENHGLPGH